MISPRKSRIGRRKLFSANGGFVRTWDTGDLLDQLPRCNQGRQETRPASMLQLIPLRNTPVRSCALGRRLLRLSRPSLTWVQNARVRKEPWDLRSGSQTEVFPLARHVRSNLKSRRCQAAPPFPKSANSRRRCELIHIPDRPSCASFFFLRARSSGLLREQMATYSSTEARRKRFRGWRQRQVSAVLTRDPTNCRGRVRIQFECRVSVIFRPPAGAARFPLSPTSRHWSARVAMSVWCHDPEVGNQYRKALNYLLRGHLLAPHDLQPVPICRLLEYRRHSDARTPSPCPDPWE